MVVPEMSRVLPTMWRASSEETAATGHYICVWKALPGVWLSIPVLSNLHLLAARILARSIGCILCLWTSSWISFLPRAFMRSLLISLLVNAHLSRRAAPPPKRCIWTTHFHLLNSSPLSSDTRTCCFRQDCMRLRFYFAKQASLP